MKSINSIIFWVIKTIEERIKTACQGLKNVKNSRDQTVYTKSISCKILKVTQDDDTPYVIAFIIRTFIILYTVHAKIVSVWLREYITKLFTQRGCTNILPECPKMYIRYARWYCSMGHKCIWYKLINNICPPHQGWSRIKPVRCSLKLLLQLIFNYREDHRYGHQWNRETKSPTHAPWLTTLNEVGRYPIVRKMYVTILKFLLHIQGSTSGILWLL